MGVEGKADVIYTWVLWDIDIHMGKWEPGGMHVGGRERSRYPCG